MLSSIGRAAIRRGGAGASYSSTNRAAQSIWSLQRVTFSQGANESSTKSTFAIAFPRSYATATKTVTKPKKTTPTKAKPKTKTAAKAKAKAKKPVKKPAKKKPAKPKAKKTKKPVKKVLTDDQKERVAIKVLKQKALSPPAGLPENAWMVLIRENRALTKGSNNVGEFSTAISAKYKSLSPEEKEVRERP
jgi:outer membrane biosynthesis protein TonB